MSVITISRQYGSGGDVIATRICEILNYRLLDRERIMQAASEVGLSEQEFIDHSEQHSKERGFRDHLFELLVAPIVGSRTFAARLSWGGLEAQMDKHWFVELVNSTVLNVYNQGDVVILGRGGQAILKDKPDVLHVRVEAPLAFRLQNVQQRQGCNEEDARQRINEHDVASARYLRQVFNVQWDDPLLYHLLLNMERWDVENAAQLVVEAAKHLEAVSV